MVADALGEVFIGFGEGDLIFPEGGFISRQDKFDQAVIGVGFRQFLADPVQSRLVKAQKGGEGGDAEVVLVDAAVPEFAEAVEHGFEVPAEGRDRIAAGVFGYEVFDLDPEDLVLDRVDPVFFDLAVCEAFFEHLDVFEVFFQEGVEVGFLF